MLKKILIAVAAILAILVVVILMQPGEFRVTRSATIAAPPATIFAEVNELKRWEAWSPWDKVDPAMKKIFNGPPAGKGASYAWAGNKDIGEGIMTIVDSTPSEKIDLKLEFIKPFAGVCQVEFAFKPVAESTEVTWTMTGKNDFLGKAMSLFVNMDKMCGDQFNKGLADLKQVAESRK